MSRRVKGLSDGLVGFDVTTLRRRYDGPDKVGKRSRAEREKIIISRTHTHTHTHRSGTVHAASSKVAYIVSLLYVQYRYKSESGFLSLRVYLKQFSKLEAAFISYINSNTQTIYGNKMYNALFYLHYTLYNYKKIRD